MALLLLVSFSHKVKETKLKPKFAHKKGPVLLE